MRKLNNLIISSVLAGTLCLIGCNKNMYNQKKENSKKNFQDEISFDNSSYPKSVYSFEDYDPLIIGLEGRHYYSKNRDTSKTQENYLEFPCIRKNEIFNNSNRNILINSSKHPSNLPFFFIFDKLVMGTEGY